MSSDIGSSSAYATEQFNILDNAGEDQFVSSPPRTTLQFGTACPMEEQAGEALNSTDTYTILAKLCPCGTKT